MKLFRTIHLITAAVLTLALGAPVYSADSSTKKSPAAAKKAAKVDINTADVATLETLPGVGPEIAKEIVAARPFTSVNDLERVPGIGPARLAELKGLVTASKVPAAKKTKAASTTKPESGATPKRATAATKVDINTADAVTLETLPGVGSQTAQAIIASRPFSSVEDLDRVPGIGAAKMAELRDKVTVSQKSVAKKDVPAPDKRSSRRTETAESTIPPASPYEPASTRSTTSTDRPLEPTGRIDTARSGQFDRGNASTAPAATRRVNINTATRAELEALPEIGPVKAQAIIDARPFTSIEEITRVKGIKEATFDAIKDQITVR